MVSGGAQSISVWHDGIFVLYHLCGFETGDVGAGDYKQFNDDLSDLGPHKKITQEYMKSGNYKVGDFIARNGHAALIIGI